MAAATTADSKTPAESTLQRVLVRKGEGGSLREAGTIPPSPHHLETLLILATLTIEVNASPPVEDVGSNVNTDAT